MKPRDITGKRFGKLVAIRLLPERYKGRTVWECQCDCGNKSNVTQHDLAAEETTSCGCHKRNVLGDSVRLEYGQSSFNQLYGGYLRGARTRGYTFTLTKDIFYELTQKDCYYCGAKPMQVHKVCGGSYGSYTYNGIDRVDNTKGYEVDNCVPCCGRCNYGKHDISQDDFLTWITRVYNHTILNAGK